MPSWPPELWVVVPSGRHEVGNSREEECILTTKTHSRAYDPKGARKNVYSRQSKAQGGGGVTGVSYRFGGVPIRYVS